MPNPTCPTNCTSALPPVSFDICAPEINLSEIQYIYIGKANTPSFADWDAPTEWATRLSQTSVTGDDYIRTLTVIGDKPAPGKTEKDISAGRKAVTSKTHVINFTIDETNAINHELVRTLECGGKFKIWYETQGGLLFGGADGIDADVFLDMVLARGREENAVYTGTVTWKKKFTEERAVSPIAH